MESEGGGLLTAEAPRGDPGRLAGPVLADPALADPALADPALAAMPGPGLESPLGVVLAGLSAAADDLGALAWWSQSHADVADAVTALGALIAQLEAARLRAVREVDTRGLAVAQGATSTTAWLRSRARLDPGEAAALVRVAGEMVTSRASAPALGRGVISFAHVRAISAALRQMPATATAEDAERAEDYLVEAARHHEPRVVARQGRMIAEVLDPDGTQPLEDAERRERNHRALFIGPGRDGMVNLRGRLDRETGLLLRELLDPLAAPRSSEEGPDVRAPEQRLGDALAELVDIAARTADVSAPRGGPARLTVTLDLSTLLGATGCLPGLTDNGEPLSAAAIRRLACDAGVLPVVLDGAGQPLDVGRSRRTVPIAIIRALAVRDGGCAFPGCDRPTAWCDAHHVVFWSHGGSTALDNLVLLCGRHHTVVHHEGWQVSIGADGHPVFRPPRWVDPDQPLLPSSRAQLRRTLARLSSVRAEPRPLREHSGAPAPEPGSGVDPPERPPPG